MALARALVREPELLLLDEPFAALDALTRLQMQDLVGDLFLRHQPAVLLVTHDVDEAIALADRILVLRDGRFAVDVRIDAPHPRDRTDRRLPRATGACSSPSSASTCTDSVRPALATTGEP